ncbi:hypothetical protein D0863_15740 [Hortaea werneckii]|uniref:Asl1-like glycosyl hydrolase catalytic domain-containing protein n=1 Tax=Hortaea werneckii TaxID=91943 RepID=A0A3M7C4K9_HORWE|nr:hypothetical protein D0863_15740 [Hortaea werneckii]
MRDSAWYAFALLTVAHAQVIVTVTTKLDGCSASYSTLSSTPSSLISLSTTSAYSQSLQSTITSSSIPEQDATTSELNSTASSGSRSATTSVTSTLSLGSSSVPDLSSTSTSSLSSANFVSSSALVSSGSLTTASTPSSIALETTSTRISSSPASTNVPTSSAVLSSYSTPGIVASSSIATPIASSSTPSSSSTGSSTAVSSTATTSAVSSTPVSSTTISSSAVSFTVATSTNSPSLPTNPPAYSETSTLSPSPYLSSTAASSSSLSTSSAVPAAEPTCGEPYTDSAGQTYSVECDIGLTGRTIEEGASGYRLRSRQEPTVDDESTFIACLESCDDTPACQAAASIGDNCLLYSSISGSVRLVGSRVGYNVARFNGTVNPDGETETGSTMVPTIQQSPTSVPDTAILTGRITGNPEDTSAFMTSSTSAIATTVDTSQPLTGTVLSSPNSSATSDMNPTQSSQSAGPTGQYSMTVSSASSGVLSENGQSSPASPSISMASSLQSSGMVSSSDITSIPVQSTSQTSNTMTSSTVSLAGTISRSSSIAQTTASSSDSAMSSSPMMSPSTTGSIYPPTTDKSSTSSSSTSTLPLYPTSSPVVPSFSSTMALSSISTTSSSVCASPTYISPPEVNDGKRGLCFTNDNYTQPWSLSGQNSQVSWGYNWFSSRYSDPSITCQYNPAIDFVPLLYSGASTLTSIWADNVRKEIDLGATAVLGFNEPDACFAGASACMSVAEAVTVWKESIEPFAGAVRLGSPGVTNAGYGFEWLDQFLGNCTDCTVDFIAIHWYANMYAFGYLQDYVRQAYERYGKPIWLTEFGYDFSEGVPTEAQVQGFLRQAVTWLDEQEYVER